MEDKYAQLIDEWNSSKYSVERVGKISQVLAPGERDRYVIPSDIDDSLRENDTLVSVTTDTPDSWLLEGLGKAPILGTILQPILGDTFEFTRAIVPAESDLELEEGQTIRAILTPAARHEMRIRGEVVEHEVPVFLVESAEILDQ